tara:strand:+ start:2956 stop:4302 length:1347 start_codon:yes stop_codon:yes gene_type:complete
MRYSNLLNKQSFKKVFLGKNIPFSCFLITFTICFLVLYISAIFNIRDYSSQIGFSSQIFDYKSFSDGEFYKDSLKYYSNWNIFENLGKNFVSGPIVPLILTKLSFENLYVIFSIFSFLISFSVYLWTKIIVDYFKPNILSKLLLIIIIFNPYNYYFVLKPGSEVPFQFFYAFFSFCLLRTFFNYQLLVFDKLKKILNFRIYFYSTFFFLFCLILTRPTSLIIGYIFVSLVTFLLIFKKAYIKLFKYDLLLVYFILFPLSIYSSFLYYEYANTAINWLNNNADAIQKFGGITNNATYFGIHELTIKSSLEIYPLIIRFPLYLLWKLSSWILGICGIRDSFSLVNNDSFETINLRIWQVILRVSYGLFIYLPTLIGSLIYFLTNILKVFKLRKNSLENISFLILSFISIGVIFPNMFFFNNERYIFMVFPALLISFAYSVKSKNFVQYLT